MAPETSTIITKGEEIHVPREASRYVVGRTRKGLPKILFYDRNKRSLPVNARAIPMGARQVSFPDYSCSQKGDVVVAGRPRFYDAKGNVLNT